MNLIDSLYEVEYNPFQYGSTIASFYSSFFGVKNSILLLPLIIPVCTHPHLRRKIVHGKSSSRLETLFSSHIEYCDLTERIVAFRKLSFDSLLVAVANDWLTIDVKNLSIHPGLNLTFSQDKVASKLAALFLNREFSEILFFLGVSPNEMFDS